MHDLMHDVAVDGDAVATCGRLRTNVERVIHGKRDIVELALVSLLAEGHLLIDDVPGVGKTELAKALARSTGGRFARIQGTPDLLPSDVTGAAVYDRVTGTVSFRPGPVFADVVLVDELNRAAPKTQSALLQVMQERQVTVEDTTHDVGRPFLVIATMNPSDHIGTYELPEAQLDRFMLSISIGYPDADTEAMLVHGRRAAGASPVLAPVVSPAQLLTLIAHTQQMHIAASLTDYLVAVVRATRAHPEVERGASPRGTIALAAAVRARAVLCGRDHATPDDVKAVAAPVLAHRLLLSPEATMQQRTARHVVADVLASVPVPTRRAGGAVARG
jgi:MoxR-like ATPase